MSATRRHFLVAGALGGAALVLRIPLFGEGARAAVGAAAEGATGTLSPEPNFTGLVADLPANCRLSRRAIPKSACSLMLNATCLSNMSWYMPISLLSVSCAAEASRMLFSIICRNRASTCCATALKASGEFGSRFSAAKPLMSV